MSEEYTPCTYCGEIADSVDHTVPRHLLKRAGELELDLSAVFRMRHWTVPSCRECNSCISGQLFPTLHQRRMCAHRAIRRKYAAFLRIPDWDDDDLASMGPVAREDIRRAINVRDRIRDRLRWRGTRTDDLKPIYELSRTMARSLKQ